MADMDTVVIRNRPNGEFISATLGPDGHKLSRFEIMRMVSRAIKDTNARDIDLEY
jgi:hypothetical protein